MISLKTSFAFALLLSTAAFSSASGNLVVNGSFETGDFGGWSLGGNTSIVGVTSIFGASDGFFAAALGPIGSNGTLAQSMATMAGHGYTFSFDLYNVDGSSNNFSAAFNSVSALSLVSFPSSNGFAHYSFDFVANTNSSSVSFAFRNDPSFFALDNVSVVDNGPVNSAPAPAALASFGFGLAARLRRRKKA